MTPEFRDLLFKSVFQDAEEPVLSVDPEGVVRSCSRGACDLLGYEPQEALGSPFARLLAEQEQGRRILDAASGVPVLKNLEVVLKCKDGGLEKSALTVRRLGDTDAAGFLILWPNHRW